MATPVDRVEILRAAVRDEPDDPVGHYLLGLELSNLSRFEEATASFRRAVELKPDYTAAYRELGKALREAGRISEAIDAFERGIAVGDQTRDVQTAKEMRVFLRRLTGGE